MNDTQPAREVSEARRGCDWWRFSPLALTPPPPTAATTTGNSNREEQHQQEMRQEEGCAHPLVQQPAVQPYISISSPFFTKRPLNLGRASAFALRTW